MARPKPPTPASVRSLQGLGLTENEGVLYTAMLAYRASTVQELLARTPFPRTMLYHVLNQLMTRGLISARKDEWKTVYVAEDPERLYDVLSSKEHEFEKERKSVRELIPKLKQQYRLAGKRTTTRTFEGVLQYQKALEDVLLAGPQVIYAYETASERKSGLEVREAQDRKRVTRKIQQYTLMFAGAETLSHITKRKYDDFTQFRTLSKDVIVPFDTDMLLYAGKILYTTYYDEHEPTALLIEDQALYDMQKHFFELLWKQGEDRTLAYTKV